MGGIYHDGDYYAGANANDRAPKSIITSDTAYNPSKNYVAGEWFIDGDVLYEVKTACQGITPPNATYYKVKTIHDLKSDISNIIKTGATTATDFNSIVDTGVYWINLSTTSGNKPPTTAPYGVLEVFQSYAGHPLQRFTIYNTNVISYQMYVRMYVNTSWNRWVLYSSESDVSTPTVTSGTAYFKISHSYTYRHGNHVHVEVAGAYGQETTEGTSIPFFTISGTSAPPSARAAGTVIIAGSNSFPSYATLGSNNYVYQSGTSTIHNGDKIFFIVDYIHWW